MIKRYCFGLLVGFGMLLAMGFGIAAYAAEPTKSALVGNETGENSLNAASVFDMARLKLGAGTGTASSNAVTINRAAGVITTEALTTAAGATQAITLTSNKILAGDAVMAVVDPGASTGTPTVANVAVSASTAVVLIQNIHASVALNAAVKVYFMVITAGNGN